jgi:hypothetical protein
LLAAFQVAIDHRAFVFQSNHRAARAAAAAIARFFVSAVSVDLCLKETHYHRKNTNKNVRNAVGPCAKVSSKYHDLPLASKFSQILVEQNCECPHDKSYNPNHH